MIFIMMTPFKIPAATIAFMLLSSIASAQSGNTGGGTMGTGTGGTSSGTTGSSATGQTGVAGSGLSGQSSFAGTVPGESTATSNAAESFIGSNATQGFVGGASQATDLQRINRQFQAIQNDQLQQRASQQTATPREIRTTLRVGFVFPTASQSQMTGRLANANIASLKRFTSNRPELAGIDVVMNSSGVATLTGSAATVETSRLAANLMRLQPGVRKVENQIVMSVK